MLASVPSNVIFYDPCSLHIKSSTPASVFGVLYLVVLNCLEDSDTLETSLWEVGAFNHNFANIVVKIGSGKNHQWICTKSRGLGGVLMKDICMVLKHLAREEIKQ